uniref:Cyclin n=1 Tax=Compsopogon caeruleus TaxID=31354 RepID=A0A6T6CQX0_9RHOD
MGFERSASSCVKRKAGTRSGVRECSTGSPQAMAATPTGDSQLNGVRTPPPIKVLRPRMLERVLNSDAREAEQRWRSRKPLAAAYYRYLQWMLRGNENNAGSEDYPPWVESYSLFFTASCTISLKTFIAKVMKNIDCSSSAYIIALLYIDRIRAGPYRFDMHDSNAKLLVLTAVMIASKFVDDKWYSNYHYGRIAGINNRRMNQLELYMLELLDFRCCVNQESYRGLEKRILLSAMDSQKNVFIHAKLPRN